MALAIGPILSANATLYVYEGFDHSGNLMTGGGAGQGTADFYWAGSWQNAASVAGFPILAPSQSRFHDATVHRK